MDSKTLALITVVALAASSMMSVNQTVGDFEGYKATFGKTYATAEEDKYRSIVF